MSSDSSVTVTTGSRVRQFGLYRNIDARTEEFLKLSKKRQIRQGCACAVVSTAITVLIVVSILLVYEYNMNSDFHLNKNYVTKSNWLGWINDSVDVTPFGQRYAKMKLNFDKTTLKLLPMLLNALKRNIYLDNLINDYSSSTPMYDERDTTERFYKKNVFSDIKKLYKMPTTRLYAIEYKTSPVAYYRSPAQSIEYFTKIRKIRDYQRILNYFDKMTGEKVGYNSAISTVTEEMYTTERPHKNIKLSTMPMKNHNTENTIHRSIGIRNSLKDSNNKQTIGCKCHKKLGELLTKLISSISHLIPYVQLPLTICKQEPLDQNSKPELNNIPAIKKNVTNISTSTLGANVAQKSATTVRTMKMSTNIKKNKISETRVFDFPLSMNFLKPIHGKVKPVSETFRFSGTPTTAKNPILATKTEKEVPGIAKPFNMIRKNEHDNQYLYTTTEQYNLVQKSIKTTDNKFNPKASSLDEDEYEDYFATTPNAINDFDILDTQSLGLVKTKMIFPTNKEEKFKTKFKESTKSDNEHIRYTEEILKPNVIKKSQYDNVSFDDKKLTKFFLTIKTTTPLPILTEAKSSSTPKMYLSKKITDDSVISVPTKISNEISILDQLLNNENFITDQDKFLEDEEFQQIDNANQTYEFDNKTETKLLQLPANNTTDEKLESTRFEEMVKIRNYNSMFLGDRPIYLEIQRNEWRQDDHQDFDMNFNNNFFELTNP